MSGMPAMAMLIVVPVLLPLATAALMLLLGDQRRKVNALLNVLATLAGLLVAAALLLWVHHDNAPGAFGVYLPGNWPVPFGIVLVVDRMSALMLVLPAAWAWRHWWFLLRAGIAPACTSTRCSSCS
jgi:multicomponent K+:H+ antiporter subunit D